jgi:hypothetical protein
MGALAVLVITVVVCLGGGLSGVLAQVVNGIIKAVNDLFGGQRQQK